MVQGEDSIAPAAGQDGPITASPLRTPKAAAWAGIVFAVFSVAAMVLIRLSAPADPGQAGAWLSSDSRRQAVSVALNLVPFAGIAFLWFVGVVRDRIGPLEDRFFATVFLGSGLLFVAMFFVAAGLAGGLVDAATAHPSSTGSDTLSLGRDSTTVLLNVYAMRMAAVFTLTTVNIARRTQIVYRWLWMTGTVVAIALLVASSASAWVELLFPSWILALSIDILLHPADPQAGAGGASPAGQAQPAAGA
ncbi:MAG TPA: hypothetical protein VHU92_29605 [Streptosporangiaceae bacterium]|jgi:hypothetical protein|nr:hypothetical protein [Streptosporangiaceae bacterium]